MEFTYEYYQKSAQYVKSRAPFQPEIGIVLGTALDPLANALEDPVSMDYAEIPNFLLATVESHPGKLIFGKLHGRRVVCMCGRFHFYEGYSFAQLAAPMRLMKLLGVKQVILTNAAGGVNPSYRVGDIMLICDHIKFAPDSPVRGANISQFGPRYFDTSDLYTKSLRELALSLKDESGLCVHEGVYFFMGGPQFETPAEIRAIRILGGDAVGMSTVTEAITAGHCAMQVLAFSVITNMAAGVCQKELTLSEVEETTAKIADRFSAYIGKIVEKM